MKHSIKDLTCSWAVLCVLSLFTGNINAGGNDYIIRVTSECPPYPNGTAQVQVVTDVPSASPYITCNDDWVYDLTPLDAGTWIQDVVFTSNNESVECVFNQVKESNTYMAYVFVPITSGLILADEAPYVIKCSYDNLGSDGDTSELLNSRNPREMLRLKNVGLEKNSNIELSVVDISGKTIAGEIKLGTTIQIQARLSGNYPDEVGVLPVSCMAVGSSSNHHILIDGCGDGTILAKEDGFATTGKTAISSYFRSFRLPGSRSLAFNCTFAICTSKCEGNSCDLQKARSGVTSASTVYLDQEFHILSASPRLSFPLDPAFRNISTLTAQARNNKFLRQWEVLNTQHTDQNLLDEIERTLLLLTIIPFGFLLLIMVLTLYAISRVMTSLSSVRKDLDAHRNQCILTLPTKVFADM